ncbi:MAG: DUF5050 domain-containing protein [Bacillota bacterium]|nr:DUF5050 domain-containing protein [Bacillota bacterium]
MGNCEKCNLEITDDERFCPSCGYLVKRNLEDAAVVRVEDGAEASTAVQEDDVKKKLWNKIAVVRKLQPRFLLLVILLPMMIVGALFPMPGGYVTNSQGTDFRNLLMGGWATTQGNWIYFCDYRGLYKMNSWNGSVKKLADGSLGALNVIGDWIYYNNGSICKIRTNGRDNTVLSGPNIWCWDMMVVDDNIYYTTDSGRKLFMMNTSGGSRRQIGSNTIVIGVNGSRLIVTDYGGDVIDTLGEQIDPRTRIYSMERDGSDKKLLFETENMTSYSGIYIQGENFYYCTYNNKNVVVKKYDMTTGKTTTVLDKNMTICELANGWIYYKLKGSDLFRASLDGSSDKRIATGVQDAFIQIDDWIVFRSGGVYRSKVGDTNKEYIGTKVPDEK